VSLELTTLTVDLLILNLDVVDVPSKMLLLAVNRVKTTDVVSVHTYVQTPDKRIRTPDF
jgi:hypothetical protein